MVERMRGLAVLVVIVVLFYLANLALLGWWTNDPLIVRAETAQMGDSSVGDPLGDSFGGSADEGSQRETYERFAQERAYDGLATWSMWTTLFTAALGLAWFLLALLRERRVFGPAGQSSLLPIWYGLVFVYVAGVVALYFFYVAPLDLFRFIEARSVYTPVGIVAVFGLIAFWAMSVFGIPPQLRPSVAGGATFS